MRIPEPVNIMTASLTPGDAIGNYVLTLKRLLEQNGKEVRLFADHISPQFGAGAQHSEQYQSSSGTLWYHYSIHASNVGCVEQPAGYRIIDYHGVSPPRLFRGYDPHLADLCEQGLDRLSSFRTAYDLGIVHSETTREHMRELGFPRVRKLPLVVDTNRFTGESDSGLDCLLHRLSYVLFVGRIVPQKDILAMLRIHKQLLKVRPGAVLVLVGGRHLAPTYQREIDRAVKRHGLAGRVLMTGQINDARLLTSFYRNAKFTLLTSEWESFCVPIVESMAFGTPPVAHRTPPLPEVMGQAGLIIDKHDPSTAAEAIHSVWSDSAAYDSLVEAALKRSHLFTEQALADQLAELFGGDDAGG